MIRQALKDSAATLARAADADASRIAKAADAIAERVLAGGTLFTFGNGGSATDAEHFAAEILGRFARDRRPLAAHALTADSATVTAIGNDYGFEEIFARQLRGLASAADVCVGISTSGVSENVVRGVTVARERGARRLGIVTVKTASDALDVLEQATLAKANPTFFARFLQKMGIKS